MTFEGYKVEQHGGDDELSNFISLESPSCGSRGGNQFYDRPPRNTLEDRRRALAAELKARRLDAKCPNYFMHDPKISLEFPVGATYAAMDNLHVYEGASAKSAEVGKVLKTCLCCILAHGHSESSWLLVEWPDGIGWVRCKNDKGTPLLDQKWPCTKYLEELQAALVTPKVNLPTPARSEVLPQDVSP